MFRFDAQIAYSCIVISYSHSIFPSLESSFSSSLLLLSLSISHPPPFFPLHLSFFILCYPCFCRRVWPQAVLLTQDLFPYSLPLYSLSLPFYLVLALALPPHSLSSHLQSLQPVNFQTSPSLLPLCLISFQIFALEWQYSSSLLSYLAKIR